MSESFELLPNGWEYVGFDLAIDTVSDAGRKIKKGDYLKSGLFPVVDQGEEKIGGYTNDAELVINSPLPIVVFGDHTRRFKFMNTPFAPGADGVKLLAPTSIFNSLFLYYQLINLDIENKGYSRHYQILRKNKFKLAPEKEQIQIVEKIEELLSDLDNGVTELKAAQTKLTQYRQSLLKSAIEGTLTQEWREANANKITENSEQLLARILKERRARWEQQKLEEFASRNQTPPKDWQKKYPEPVKPDTSDLPELPGGWVWASVDQLVASIEAGKSFKCLERPPQGNDFGVLKVSAVTWGEYNEEESKTCLNKNNENPKILVSEGDFLFSRANTTELVGACVIAKKITKNIMLSDKIWRILFVDDSFKYWVLQYLRGPYGRTQIELSASGNQASMKNISQEKLKCFAIPIAPIKEIDFIESELSKIFSQIDAQVRSNVAQLKQADAQRNNILKDAFSGKLVPQNPSDKPASALLEKIKAERLAQLKQTKSKLNKKKEPSMNTLDAAAVKKWVSQQTEAFTFEQLQSVFDGDYETLKDIVFEILQEERAVIRQVFNKKSQHMMLEKA